MTKAVLPFIVFFLLFAIRYTGIIISVSNFPIDFSLFGNYNFIYLYVSIFKYIQVLGLRSIMTFVFVLAFYLYT